MLFVTCRGVLLNWIRVGQEPTALAVVASGGCLDIFLSTIIYFFFLPVSGRRPDIDCLKGPLSPNNQPTIVVSGLFCRFYSIF